MNGIHEVTGSTPVWSTKPSSSLNRAQLADDRRGCAGSTEATSSNPNEHELLAHLFRVAVIRVESMKRSE